MNLLLHVAFNGSKPPTFTPPLWSFAKLFGVSPNCMGFTKLFIVSPKLYPVEWTTKRSKSRKVDSQIVEWPVTGHACDRMTLRQHLEG